MFSYLQPDDAVQSLATTQAWDFVIPPARRFLFPLSLEPLTETIARRTPYLRPSLPSSLYIKRICGRSFYLHKPFSLDPITFYFVRHPRRSVIYPDESRMKIFKSLDNCDDRRLYFLSLRPKVDSSPLPLLCDRYLKLSVSASWRSALTCA